ncbi:hypothetical protein CEE45_12305 [Candidatus Heimdallarchaeota archaeon B3_Heim]|nr:MAG: hypothetical protein CEE45_12305 [Candidatus Heimdallarchaeota archaeon B3_Heim]
MYLETENTSILGLQWDSNLYTPYSGVQEVQDETGTPWLNISKEYLIMQGKNANVKLTIRVKSRNHNQSYKYQAYNVNESKWILPTKYIDNNHTKILNVALDLNKSGRTRLELIKDILSFVQKNIFYKDANTSFGYNETFYGETGGRASDTLERGYGVCRHYSRLFVALCRALGIPARYVSGYLINLGEVKAESHAWAEFLDEEQYWHMVEPQSPYQTYNSLLYFNTVHGPFQPGSLAEESFFSDESVIISFNDEDELDMIDAFLEKYDESWQRNDNYYLFTTGLILSGYLILVLMSKNIQKISHKTEMYKLTNFEGNKTNESKPRKR